MEPENGQMEMFIKVILLMAFNKVKEFLNAKMEDGPTKESGNKEKWIFMASVGGKMALLTRDNGGTVSKKARVY